MDKNFFIKFMGYLMQEEKKYADLIANMTLLDGIWNEKHNSVKKVNTVKQKIK